MGEKKDSTYCGCLYYSASALARVMTRMADESFAPTGLSSSLALLLMTVHKRPGIQPCGISEQMQLSPSTITRLVEKLEHKGLIERQSEGRTTRVYPTSVGSGLSASIEEAWKKLYAKYSGLLGEEKSRELTAAIYEASRRLEG